MSSATEIIIGLLAVTVTVYLLAQLVAAFRLYLTSRGERLVTCPETNRPAAVKLDARHAAMEGVVGRFDFRLRDCSRWPERQGCPQDCMKQIESAPDGCLVRSLVERWYAGKTCAYCGRPIHEVEWEGHRPALRTPEGKTLEWSEVPAEQLPEVFATHAPVCWDCHIMATFQRLYPGRNIARHYPEERVH
jgi:hypothetical protein